MRNTAEVVSQWAVEHNTPTRYRQPHSSHYKSDERYQFAIMNYMSSILYSQNKEYEVNNNEGSAGLF